MTLFQIADDILMRGVKNAWEKLKDINMIEEKYRCNIKGLDIDCVLGSYNASFFW